MSGYILCQTPVADRPFFISNIQMNIYSLEELCYFLRHNLYLVDQTIMCEDLCRWISQELALTSLASKLKDSLGKYAGPEDFLYPIFKEINYLSYEELRALRTELEVYDARTPLDRMSHRGDAFMGNHMYLRAIDVYEKCLAQLDPEEMKIRRRVLHNLGVAYTRLFLMNQASDYFRQAYELSHDISEGVACVLAFRPEHTPIEYENLILDLEDSDQIRQEAEKELARFARIPETPVYTQHVDEILDRLMSEYHHSMAEP